MTSDNGEEQFRPTKKQRAAYDELRQAFLGCGRCSFFLAAYRAQMGAEKMFQASEERQGNFLQLGWDREMRELVYKSYGWRIDLDATHFSASCPECRRSYTLELVGDEDEAPLFEIEIIPRTRLR